MGLFDLFKKNVSVLSANTKTHSKTVDAITCSFAASVSDVLQS